MLLRLGKKLNDERERGTTDGVMNFVITASNCALYFWPPGDCTDAVEILDENDGDGETASESLNNRA